MSPSSDEGATRLLFIHAAVILVNFALLLLYLYILSVIIIKIQLLLCFALLSSCSRPYLGIEGNRYPFLASIAT